MTLENYKKKRDFQKTKEPSGVEKDSSEISKHIYVVQEHHASHLHWDLRLEMDGVLKSWAVPKEPSTNQTVKRLAVMVEDHPLEYAKFEGTISDGNYGAGTVKIWDRGTFEIIEKTDNGFVVKINGNKLKGTYVLFKFKPPKNWLFFKKKE
jgi:DNA ligase D-like protein (predicted 3'-phosphoesterase)